MVCLGERGSGTTGDARGAAGGAWRPGARSGTEGAPLLGGARERGGRVTQVRYTRRRSLRPMCMASVFTTGPPLPSSNWRPTQGPLCTFPVLATSSAQGRCSARTSDRAPARRAAGRVAAAGAARPAGRLTRGTHCSAPLSKRAVSSVRCTARQRGSQALWRDISQHTRHRPALIQQPPCRLCSTGPVTCGAANDACGSTGVPLCFHMHAFMQGVSGAAGRA